ncbi:MAG: DUF4255 domain-containing protein [Gammaproteobacteria bacterium]|nr:DUF4255 domain-containing protein [Gammaproteobacteria bacterium]
MSTSLGISAVTTVLQSVLSNRLAGVSGEVGGSVAVTAVAPDRVDLSGASDPNQVNLFLYQVVPNPGWTGMDLPARNNNARRISAPPLVLDLHYLISIYAANALVPEILLGEVMQEFHERPIPTRTIITNALNPTSPPAGFPTELANSGLAEQIENIRITPEAISNEEMSKLWTALQAHYRMSVAYQVTTVIIDSEAPAVTALPVSRPLGYAQSSSFPVLLGVAAQAGTTLPIIAGTAIRISGSQLGDLGLTVLVDDVDLSAEVTERREDYIDLMLPDPLPAGIHAGAASVQVVRNDTISEPPELRRSVASNPVVMVLRPTFIVNENIDGGQDVVVDSVTLRSGVFELTLNPAIQRGQKLRVCLNQTGGDLRAYTFRGPDGHGMADTDTQTTTVDVPFSRVAAGSYLIRVQVDVSESVLSIDGGGVYNGPLVAI